MPLHERELGTHQRGDREGRQLVGIKPSLSVFSSSKSMERLVIAGSHLASFSFTADFSARAQNIIPEYP
jgi:hypothetical protein